MGHEVERPVACLKALAEHRPGMPQAATSTPSGQKACQRSSTTGALRSLCIREQDVPMQTPCPATTPQRPEWWPRAPPPEGPMPGCHRHTPATPASRTPRPGRQKAGVLRGPGRPQSRSRLPRALAAALPCPHRLGGGGSQSPASRLW